MCDARTAHLSVNWWAYLTDWAALMISQSSSSVQPVKPHPSRDSLLSAARTLQRLRRRSQSWITSHSAQPDRCPSACRLPGWPVTYHRTCLCRLGQVRSAPVGSDIPLAERSGCAMRQRPFCYTGCSGWRTASSLRLSHQSVCAWLLIQRAAVRRSLRTGRAHRPRQRTWNGSTDCRRRCCCFHSHSPNAPRFQFLLPVTAPSFHQRPVNRALTSLLTTCTNLI